MALISDCTPYMIHPSREAARAIAQPLNDADDEWTYHVIVLTDGRAVIQVRDQDGIILGNL